jgi:hypothetical protein
MDQVLEDGLPVSMDNSELLLLNKIPQLSELCYRHQIQSLLYLQQITLCQVNAFLDNGMRTFRTRCHTQTQVYVLICKTSDETNLIRHPCFLNKRYQPALQFLVLVLEIRPIAQKISLRTTFSQWLMKDAHIIPSSSLLSTNK